MSRRPVWVSLLLVVGAVLVQTTFFARVRPLGVAPDLVLVVVYACALRLDAEAAVILGFTGGIFLDLLGTMPLGLHAMAFAVVAYATVRLRHRIEISILSEIGGAAFASVVGLGLIALVGTLFGEGLLAEPDIGRTFLVAPLWDLLLATVLVPLAGRLLARPPVLGGVIP